MKLIAYALFEHPHKDLLGITLVGYWVIRKILKTKQRMLCAA